LIGKDDEIRPYIKELFEYCVQRGFEIIVWSGGGVYYVERQLRHIEFKLWPGKINPIPITIIPKDFSSCTLGQIVSGFFVDDSYALIDYIKSAGGRAHKVTFYEPAINAADTELLDLITKLKDLK
jgi:hypothetical protein